MCAKGTGKERKTQLRPGVQPIPPQQKLVRDKGPRLVPAPPTPCRTGSGFPALDTLALGRAAALHPEPLAQHRHAQPSRGTAVLSQGSRGEPCPNPSPQDCPLMATSSLD